MNRLKKYSKIMLIIFVLAIISIITPNMIYATYTGTDGDGNTIEVEDYTIYNGADSFEIKYSEFNITNTWYLLCNQLGGKFRTVETYYTKSSTETATVEESYLLAGMDEYNYKDDDNDHYSSSGQNAWWNRSSLSTEDNVINSMWIEAQLPLNFKDAGVDKIIDLISNIINGTLTSEAEGTEELTTEEIIKSELADIINEYTSTEATTENVNELYDVVWTVCTKLTSGTSTGSTLSEEAKAFANYISSVSQKDSDGNIITKEYKLIWTENGEEKEVTVTAPVIELAATIIDDNVSVAFSETDNAYVIGPFKLQYSYNAYNNTIFSGLDSSRLTLKTNLGEMTYGTDWFISYTSDGSEAINGLPLPGSDSGDNSTGEFYIILNYQPGITEITELGFRYRYINAGGAYAVYDGYMKYCNTQGTYVDHDHDCSDDEIVNTQELAMVLRGIIWYSYQDITWEGKIYDKGTIEITKNTIDELGSIVAVNDTFYFDIYIDYHEKDENGNDIGEVLFETVAVSTTNGTGSKTITPVYWSGTDAPKYRVVEHSQDGYYTNENSWEGTLSATETIKITCQNYVNPDKGRIEIDKQLLNATDTLEETTYEFTVYVWGEFKYDGGELSTYSASDPLEIKAYITGSGEWVSGLFEWYGDAPQYKTSETVSDTSDFELVSTNNKTGTITSNENTVEDEDIINSVVTFVNQPRDKSQIIINKELVDGSTPESGETFTVAVTITGDFIYKDSNGEETRYTSDGDEFYTEVSLTESNDWSWESGTIYWTTTTAPTYEIEEIEMPEDYELSRIDSASGSLNTEQNIIHVYNAKKAEPDEGYLQIEKILETDVDDLENNSFSYEIVVTGNFTYDGTEYTSDGDSLIITGTISVGDVNEYGPFYWDEGTDAPTYTVTETELEDRDDASFVSISNGDSVVTNTTSVSGSLKDDDTVIVTMRNRGTTEEPVETKIQIKKDVTGNTSYLEKLKDEGEDISFTFQVELTGTFTYTDEDGTVTNIENDTLTISDITIDVLDNDTWTSGVIEWDSNLYTAPTYRITEINIPDWAEIQGWDGRTNSVETSFISGTLTEDTINIFICYNEITVIPQYGRIQIEKELLSDLISSDEQFNFTVTVSGEFTYTDEEGNETSYPNDDNESLELTVSVSADSPWTSGLFYWETDEAPTYIITENLTEEQIEAGIEVEGFTNSSQSTTTKAISGSLIGSEDEDAPTVAKVIAQNNYGGPKTLKGKIQITKEYYDANGNEIDGVEFNFIITITYANGTISNIPVTIESGTTWRSDYFYWDSTEEAPTYEIVETSTGYFTSTITPDSGQLEADTIIKVTATNNGTEPNQGKISLTKYIVVDDKTSVTDYTGTFTFTVTVSGTFTYTNNNETTSVVDDTLTLTVTISINGTESGNWTSGIFEWYGDEAPTYSVEETNLPTGWWLVEMENSSGNLIAGGTVQVSATNETAEIMEIIITMEMGGKVWDDTDYSSGKEADVGENGIIDDDEPGIEGVKVTITRLVTDSSGNVIARLDTVYAYNENSLSSSEPTLINNYTYTDSDGNWSFGAISVPAFNLNNSTEKSYYEKEYDISYDVTFSYDGQTYEPTTYLVTSNGDASEYRNASTSARDAWLNDSMAVDDTSVRQAFNAKFTNIEGQDPMQSDGTTVGKATGGSSDVTLNYTSTDTISTVNSDNTRKVSTLQTTDENGNIYEDFLIDASTSTNGLTYPFDNEYQLESWDKTVDPITGLKNTSYKFSATYNYLLSINLGLIKREAADIALEKDLTEAIVVINGKVLKYKFNSAIDLEDEEYVDLLYQQIAVADEEIEYTLGLYSSDYYYRASIYDSDSELSSALESFYDTTLGVSTAEATELQIYLKYTINVYNESETYDVKINEIADYYDETFTLITDADDSATYVQTLNGEYINEVVNLAETSTVTYYSAGNVAGNTQDVTWSSVSETITGSDNVTYNKITTTSLSGTLLSSGQRAEIQLTFRVNKSTSTDGYNIEDSIVLGEKHNVAEVTSFSTYYSSTSKNKWSSAGQVAGRVDEDSAPDNVNIAEYNEKSWYEDDTDSAPILTVELYDEDREVNGLVWEDAETNTVQYSQTIGDGIYNPDQGDKTIEGLTTEIVETISVPTEDSEGNVVYKEYEFIWPTEDETIEGLNGYSLQTLTGFDSTITTGSDGTYAFTAVPAGNYKIRFVYGDTLIATGNEGYEEVYNGQDYKSTSYQTGFNNDSESDDETADGYGYIDNEWHDLSNSDLEAIRVSDARDVEARRLVVASYSEILQYDNTSILATADDYDADHTELFGTTTDEEGNEISGYEYAKTQDGGPVSGDGYYMYAETAKINIEVENVYDINYITETIGELDNAFSVEGTTSKGAVTSGNEFEYFIDNIDFGLEERSQTKLTLDKQIKELTLTTSDGNVILDAVYDIEYELGDDDTIKSSVTLNKSLSTGYSNLASLNRTSTSQGYRYIMAEGTILQGATVTVQYQLMVFNVGEADTCNQILKDLWDEINTAGYEGNAFDEAVQKLSSPYYTAEDGRIFDDGTYKKYQYGTYFGSIYYLGTQGTYSEDTILVESTVHQVIDYVDPDVEFVDYDNISVNQSWSSVSIDDLIGYVDDGLLDPAIIQIVNDEEGEPVSIDEDGNIVTDYDGRTIYELTYYNILTMDGITEETYNTITSGLIGDSPTYRYTVINDNLQEYVTDSKNNIILSIDNSSDSADAGTNPSLVKATVPYTSHEENEDLEIIADNIDELEFAAVINLTVSRYYSSESDASDIDNIAEIIKTENTVGRRDIRVIAGNTSTYELVEGATGYDETVDLYTISLEEPDTSATELITLSPPTGLNPTVKLILQIVGTVTVAGIIIAVGIIVIKKKVLLKTIK